MFEANLEDSRFDYSYANEIDDRLEPIIINWKEDKFNIGSLFKVDQHIYEMYRQNSSNFALIPFQLVIYCLKEIKAGNNIINIEKKIGETVAKLAEKYPPSSSNEENKSVVSLKSF